MNRLWLRWSWRDLRSRWLQVLAIAAIIALGTGVYTGLSSQNRWREASYDASYEALAIHDVVVRTTEGTFVDEGTLRAALEALPSPGAVAVAEERLVVRTQVDATDLAGEPVLVPGRIVGVDVTGDDAGAGPRIDQLEVVDGRALEPADAGRHRVVLDSHFADHHDIAPTGNLVLGTGPVEVVGLGFSPEYFLVTSDSGSMLAAAGFAVMFASLETTQGLTDLEGQVNEVVLRWDDQLDDAARDLATTELADTLDREVADAALVVERIEENRQYRRLYDDIDGDQQLFNIFAGLILVGAAFAAFNLTGRIVEAQRREIGIGMALGTPRHLLAVRPLLVGVQVALVGVVLGVAVGMFVGSLMSDLNQQFVPLPVWGDPFLADVFARGAALGLGLTVLATVWPVWRAVRVDPVDAIRTGPHRSGGNGPSAGWLRLPGGSIAQFPVRNTVRAPRRTALTALGIAAMIAVLIAVVGMIDSMLATIDQGESEILGDAPDRVEVTLDFFTAIDDPRLDELAAAPGVAAVEPGLRLGGTLVAVDGEEIESLVQLVDLDSTRWRPTALAGSLAEVGDGLVLSRKAADDLGVAPGDVVEMRHPRREGLGYRLVTSELPVAAVHANPYRFVTYMDVGAAPVFALEGLVNTAAVHPSAGFDAEDLVVELFGRPGVAAVEPVGAVAQNIRDVIAEFLGLLTVVQGAVLLLALLIAFNSTAISADERRREHATMFAFGLPVRTVVALAVAESAIVGVLGTVAGVIAGRLLLQWLLTALIPETLPDLGMLIDVASSTYLTAGLLGVGVVAVAPLLTLRRLRRMDVPSTLRVVE